MTELFGDLWALERTCVPAVVCITTNGFVKRNGEAVMGRGCAREAAMRYPQLPKRLGTYITRCGNVVHCFPEFNGLVTFPVKHVWWQPADLELIRASAGALREIALKRLEVTYLLPRPGCGNGKLQWADVKPLLEGLPENVRIVSYAR